MLRVIKEFGILPSPSLKSLHSHLLTEKPVCSLEELIYLRPLSCYSDSWIQVFFLPQYFLLSWCFLIFHSLTSLQYCVCIARGEFADHLFQVCQRCLHRGPAVLPTAFVVDSYRALPRHATTSESVGKCAYHLYHVEFLHYSLKISP